MESNILGTPDKRRVDQGNSRRPFISPVQAVSFKTNEPHDPRTPTYVNNRLTQRGFSDTPDTPAWRAQTRPVTTPTKGARPRTRITPTMRE